MCVTPVIKAPIEASLGYGVRPYSGVGVEVGLKTKFTLADIIFNLYRSLFL